MSERQSCSRCDSWTSVPVDSFVNSFIASHLDGPSGQPNPADWRTVIGAPGRNKRQSNELCCMSTCHAIQFGHAGNYHLISYVRWSMHAGNFG